MKFLAFVLFFFSSIVAAQPTYILTTTSEGAYELRKDSFIQYKERSGSEYVGLTINFIPKGQKKVAEYVNYRLLKPSCKLSTQELVTMDNYNDKILNRITVEKGPGSFNALVAYYICSMASQAEDDPGYFEDSIQKIMSYVQSAPDKDWTEFGVFPESTENMSVITKSPRKEDEIDLFSMVARIQNPKKTTEYYKIYINPIDCKNKKGTLILSNMIERTESNIAFELDVKPKDKKQIYMNKVANMLCTSPRLKDK